MNRWNRRLLPLMVIAALGCQRPVSFQTAGTPANVVYLDPASNAYPPPVAAQPIPGQPIPGQPIPSQPARSVPVAQYNPSQPAPTAVYAQDAPVPAYPSGVTYNGESSAATYASKDASTYGAASNPYADAGDPYATAAPPSNTDGEAAAEPTFDEAVTEEGGLATVSEVGEVAAAQDVGKTAADDASATPTNALAATASNDIGGAVSKDAPAAAPASHPEVTFQRKPISYWKSIARDLDPNTRVAAIPALAAAARHARDKEATAILVQIVKDAVDPSESNLRLTAMQSLTTLLARREMADVFVDLLKVLERDSHDHNSQGVRRIIILGLAAAQPSWSSPTAKTALKEAMESRDLMTRHVAGLILLGTDGEGAVASLEQFEKWCGKHGASMDVSFMPTGRIIDNLLGVLENGPAELHALSRRHAAILITNFDAQLKGLRQYNPAASSQFDREKATTGMLDAAGRGSEEDRTYAILALGALGNERAREGLKERLDDPSPTVRDEAARVFARASQGHDGVAQQIASELKDATPERRAVLLRVIGELRTGGPELIGALEPMLESDHDIVKARALIAIGACGAYNMRLIDEKILPAIDSDNHEIRDAAIKAFIFIGPYANQVKGKLDALDKTAGEENDGNLFRLIHLLRQSLEGRQILNSATRRVEVSWPKLR